jgi:hypothetical protein
MRLDHEVSLTRKHGSRWAVHVYGQPAPHRGDVVALPVDRKMISAKIEAPETATTATVAEEVALCDDLPGLGNKRGAHIRATSQDPSCDEPPQLASVSIV